MKNDQYENEEDSAKVVTELPEKKMVKTEASPAAQKVAEDKSPMTAKEADTRKPSNILPSLSNSLGKFTVQIASYSKEAEAAKHTAQLKEKGYTSFYSAANVKGQKWFRVSIGVFNKTSQANKYKKQLLKKGHFSSALVKKITQ